MTGYTCVMNRECVSEESEVNIMVSDVMLDIDWKVYM